jgi:hypothetical protein
MSAMSRDGSGHNEPAVLMNRRFIVEQRIQKAIEKFATGLTKEITAVIYDDLIEDLQTQRASNKVTLKNGKKTRKNGTARKNGKKVTAKKATAKKTNGAKRTPAQIEKIAARALAAITKKPGQNIEAIAKATKLGTKDLTLPVRKLIADKAIRTKGERRATKYFPKGKKASAKAS